MGCYGRRLLDGFIRRGYLETRVVLEFHMTVLKTYAEHKLGLFVMFMVLSDPL